MTFIVLAQLPGIACGSTYTASHLHDIDILVTSTCQVQARKGLIGANGAAIIGAMEETGTG